MTEWLNVQSVYDQLAGVVLVDLLNHGEQERHVLCYVGLSSKNQYNTKTLALKLKDALQKHVRTGKDGAKYRDLAQSETLIGSDAKRVFMEVLCTLLGSNIQVFNSTDDSVLMFARPAPHINPLRAVPYKLSLRTKSIIKADLFAGVLSSAGSSSDQESLLSACSEDDMPSVSKKLKLSGKKKNKVAFENLDQAASSDLLGAWSKQEMSEIDKRKQVLQNVCLFIDKFQEQVGKHVTDCQQCPAHCYSVLNKCIKKIPGRPSKKR